MASNPTITTVQYGSVFRFINDMDGPFTSLDGVVVDPDIVSITFTPTASPNSTPTPVTFTYTNGAIPPDPSYMVNRFELPIASVTPSYPVPGQVGYTTTGNNNFIVGQTVTIAGISTAGYNGTFTVAAVQSDGGFSVINSTTTTPTVSSPTVTANGIYYMDVDTTAYTTGVWEYYISGEPGPSGIDLTKTKVRSQIYSLLVE
jgi:hypothetical protein